MAFHDMVCRGEGGGCGGAHACVCVADDDYLPGHLGW